MKHKLLYVVALIILVVVSGILIYFIFFRENELESEYLSIKDGKYIDSELPIDTDAPNLISDIKLNKTVITGGSNIIDFSSKVLLKEIMVGVNGIKGYINVPAQYTFDKTNNLYYYTILLSLSQKLELDFNLNIVVKTEEGKLSKPHSTDISTVKAGTGSLQISLSWDLDDDLDLHVFEPDSNEVSYKAPYSFPQDMDLNKFYFDRNVWLVKEHFPEVDEEFKQSNFLSKMKLKYYVLKLRLKINIKKETSRYMKEMQIPYCGELDIDSNPACNLDKIRNENIYYTIPEPGKYTVKINLFSRCESVIGINSAKYSVTVKYNNKDMKLDSGHDCLQGQIPESLQDNSKKSNFIEICTFTIPGEVIIPKEKQEVDTDMFTFFDKLMDLL